MEKIKLITNFGIPRFIILLFFCFHYFSSLLCECKHCRITERYCKTDLGANAVMVLAMVPMIQGGSGLNFGLSVGVIGGFFRCDSLQCSYNS